MTAVTASVASMGEPVETGLGLRRLGPDDWRLFRELRLQALAEAPDAFSATLADWCGARDVEERWRSRLVSVPFNLIVRLDGAAAGMISAMRVDPERIELLSMWVAPWARGRGVGDALVGAALRWAINERATAATLAVYWSNSSALKLYRRHGFAIEPQPVGAGQGLRMARLLPAAG